MAGDTPWSVSTIQFLVRDRRSYGCDDDPGLLDDVKLDEVAALTPGFTGADLANLVNEAALIATRRNAEAVTSADFTAAIERA